MTLDTITRFRWEKSYHKSINQTDNDLGKYVFLSIVFDRISTEILLVTQPDNLDNLKR